MFEKTVTLIKSNIGQSIAVLIASCLVLWLFGCQPKTESLNGSKILVNRTQLENELDHILSVAELRFQELDQQDRMRQIIFDSAIIMAQSGKVSPLGILTTLGAIFGAGATVDNVAKRKKLKELIAANNG